MDEEYGSKSVSNNAQSDISANAHTSVLIVEDDRSHRTLIDKALISCDFKTTLAANGFDALRLIDLGHHFDLIVMDIDMPKLDGLETTKAIRTRENADNSARKPIIAFTASRTQHHRQNCLDAGMDAYLPKDAFLPKWHTTLIENLRGLIDANANLQDIHEETPTRPDSIPIMFDLNAFDEESFAQTQRLLKDELEIAIEEYLEDAAAYISEIKAGIEGNNFNAIKRGSHPLKSNSKSFGLTSVSEIAENINLLSEHAQQSEQTLQRIEVLFPQLKQAFHNAEKILQQKVQHEAQQALS